MLIAYVYDLLLSISDYVVKHFQFLLCGKYSIIIGLVEALKAMEMLVVLFA
jgi:hypothetical protein